MATIATLRDLIDALIESAKEEKKLGEVTSNLELFYGFIFSNEELKDILSNTIFDVEERKSVVKEICAKSSLSNLTGGFLSLVVEMGKFKAFLNSKELVIGKLKEAAGKISAELITAEELASSDFEKIKEAISKATGKEVEILVKVDPSIIGGMIAKVEDRVYDSSIKTQLERMRGVLSPS
ncbi:MAG: ATP synthase F1 subunit delta [Thermodesulfobacteriota bacterium]